MSDKELFHSCESVDDVTFDLNGDQHTGLGWVVFEIEDEKQRQVTGAIGISNNFFTLKLLRHLNSRLPLSIRGRFIDNANQGAQSYTLDNVVPSGTLLSDAIGFILFRANVSKLVQERDRLDKKISLLIR